MKKKEQKKIKKKQEIIKKQKIIKFLKKNKYTFKAKTLNFKKAFNKFVKLLLIKKSSARYLLFHLKSAFTIKQNKKDNSLKKISNLPIEKILRVDPFLVKRLNIERFNKAKFNSKKRYFYKSLMYAIKGRCKSFYYNYKYKRKFRRVLKFICKEKVKNAVILKKKFLKKISIRVGRNNAFCTLTSLKKEKTLFVYSSGKSKINLSKKKLKYFLNIFINKFFQKIKKYTKNWNNTIINLTVPKKKRFKFLKLLKYNLKKKYEPLKNVLININPKKCFNGCRAKKVMRKKRHYVIAWKK